MSKMLRYKMENGERIQNGYKIGANTGHEKAETIQKIFIIPTRTEEGGLVIIPSPETIQKIFIIPIKTEVGGLVTIPSPQRYFGEILVLVFRSLSFHE